METTATEITQGLTEAEIKEWLLPIQDPEIFLSIVELGLVYRAGITKNEATQKYDVTIHMTLTSPGCPLGGEIIEAVRQRLLSHPQVENAGVDLVWDPPWDPREMASEEVKMRLGIW